MRGILIAIVLLITYGSLYPWAFVAHELPASPIYLLFHSWEFATGRRFLADMIVNVALYVPVGMFGYLAFGRFRWLGPVALGAVLSGCIEMAQLYTPSRDCSTVDLATNVAGSMAGVLVGLVFERLAGPVRISLRAGGDRAAVALLFCWIAAMVFPVFPDTSLPDWARKAGVLVHGAGLRAVFNPLALISAAASWFAAGSMMRRRVWLVAALVLIPAQIFIATRQPLPVHLLGAVIGIALVFLAPNRRVAGWGFLGVLVVRGLAPFRISAAAHAFAWTPFEALLNTEWQSGIQILLEKVFWYGAAVWLLRRAGLRWGRAMAWVCAVLAAVEIAQTHIPGRTPEITDPLLAAMAGLAIMRIHDQRPIRLDSSKS